MNVHEFRFMLPILIDVGLARCDAHLGTTAEVI